MIDIDDKVLNDLRGGFNLPAKPEILQALQNELSQPEPELFTVADIIAADVGASAAVLKVINSPSLWSCPYNHRYKTSCDVFGRYLYYTASDWVFA